MTINARHDEIERGMEAMWARAEDAKAIAALRARMDAEAEMAANVAAVQERSAKA